MGQIGNQPLNRVNFAIQSIVLTLLILVLLTQPTSFLLTTFTFLGVLGTTNRLGNFVSLTIGFLHLSGQLTPL